METNEKLAKATEQLELLKGNMSDYSIEDQLKLASEIRQHIANDEMISAACVHDSSLFELRKQLFDSIKTLQKEIISNILTDKQDSMPTYKIWHMGHFAG